MFSAVCGKHLPHLQLLSRLPSMHRYHPFDRELTSSYTTSSSSV